MLGAKRYNCGLDIGHDGECRRHVLIAGNLGNWGVYDNGEFFTVERPSMGCINTEILHSGDSRDAAVSYFRRWVR